MIKFGILFCYNLRKKSEFRLYSLVNFIYSLVNFVKIPTLNFKLSLKSQKSDLTSQINVRLLKKKKIPQMFYINPTI